MKPGNSSGYKAHPFDWLRQCWNVQCNSVHLVTWMVNLYYYMVTCSICSGTDSVSTNTFLRDDMQPCQSCNASACLLLCSLLGEVHIAHLAEPHSLLLLRQTCHSNHFHPPYSLVHSPCPLSCVWVCAKCFPPPHACLLSFTPSISLSIYPPAVLVSLLASQLLFLP